MTLYKPPYIDRSGTPVGSMLDKFESYLRNYKNYTYSTAHSYRRMMEVFIDTRKIVDLTDITCASVDDYCDERVGRGLSVDSNALFMNCIRSFLRYCNRHQGTSFAVDTFEVPRRKNRRTDFVTPEELTSMVEVTQRERDRLMLLVHFTSGCRASELIQMTVENFRDNSWHCLVKGGKEHVYYFDPNVAERLRLFLYVMGIERSAVWRMNNGRPIKVSAYAMMVKTAAKRAGVERRVSSHQLRHGFATSMLENGTDIRTLAQMMGHNSIQTTERYLHITDKRAQEHHRLYAPKVVNPQPYHSKITEYFNTEEQ